MPKRQTKAEDIRDPWHYFNRYISKEILQDQKKQAEYYKMFASLDELLSEETAGLSRRTQMLLATNLDGAGFERELSEMSPFAWIEQIGNPDLYTAIQRLPLDEKYLLTFRYQFCFSQRETAALLGVTQQSISQKERTLKKFFRKILKKGCQKT